MPKPDLLARLVPHLHRRGHGEPGWVVSYRVHPEPGWFPHRLYAWLVRPVNHLLCWRYGHSGVLRHLWLVYGMAEPQCPYCTKEVRQPGTKAIPGCPP